MNVGRGYRPNLPEFDDTGQELLNYLQTRLRSRAANLVPDRQYARLLEMDPEQIAHYLSESGYGEQARSLGLTASGAELVRAIVVRHLADEMAKLRKICCCSLAALAWIRAYCWKYDLAQFRFMLRARQAGLKPNSTVVVAAMANLPADAYRDMTEAEKVELDAPGFSALSASPFAQTLRHHFEEEECDQEVLEFSLLEDYYHGVIGTLLQAVPEDDPARALLACDIHYVNLSTILSGRLSGAQADRLQARLLPLDLWAKESLVRDALRENDLAGTVNALRDADGSGFFKTLAEMPEALADCESLERSARRALLRTARAALRSGATSPACLICYLSLLEIEARNLTALAAGKKVDLSIGEMESLLITDTGDGWRRRVAV